MTPIFVAGLLGTGLLGTVCPAPVTAQDNPPPIAPAAIAAQTGVLGRAVWDERFIYIAIVVSDSDVLGTNVRPMSPVQADDSIGFYFHTQERTDTPTNRTNAMLISAAGGFIFLTGNDAQKTLDPRPVFTMKYGVTVQGTLNRSDDRDRGYTITAAIPWEVLGLDGKALKAGTEIAFATVVRRRGTGEDKGSLTATAEGVKGEADALSPTKWGTLLLTTAEDPKAATPPAGTVVATRVPPSAKPPSIDGVIRLEEWAKAGQFAFASPDVPKPVVAVEPVILPGMADESVAPVMEYGETIPDLGPRVFARYLIGYQANGRKLSSPVRGLYLADATLALADQPATGVGPWFSNDRTVWHAANLAEMRQVGVDIALVQFVGPDNPLGNLDEKALLVMASALRELRAQNVPTPFVAPCVDTAQLVAPDQPKIDLATPAGQEVLYRAIRRWFQTIPEEFRAKVLLPPDKGGRTHTVYPVYLSSASGITNMSDVGWKDEIRKRFAAEFGIATGGTTLLLCGGDGFTPDSGLYAITPFLTGEMGTGAVSTVVIRPGSGGLDAPLVPRKNGKTYREAWLREEVRRASWVIIDSWNDWLRGTEIATSRQYGPQYQTLTRLLTVQLSGINPRNYMWVSHDTPRRLRPGQLVGVTVAVKNIGVEALRGTEGVALTYRWRDKEGKVVAESPLRVRLSDSFMPTRTENLIVGVLTAFPDSAGKLTALPPGDYILEIGFTQNRLSEPLTLYGEEPGSKMTPPLRVPVRIVENLPPLVEFDGTTTPTIVVSGGSYPVQVRLRWLGENPLTPAEAQLLYQVTTEDGKNTVLTATVPLDRVLQPGVWTNITTEFRAGEAGATLPPAVPETRSAPTDTGGGGYRVRWLLSRKESTETVPGEYVERIAVYPASDEGEVQAPSKPIARLNAGALTTIEVTVTNRSQNVWTKDAYSVGYHWYYPDGVEFQWQPAVSTNLPRNLEPGKSVKMAVTVRAPDRDGEYILAFDILRNPDTFLSTLPVTRNGDMGLVPVRVVGGRLTFVELDRYFNADGVANEANPGDGDLDGQGFTLPAESFPPDIFGIAAYFDKTEEGQSNKESPVYPSGHFSNVSRAARMVSFRYGRNTDGAKNVIVCQGQSIPLPKARFATLHIAAVATGGEDRPLNLTVRFKDGSTKDVTINVADWNRTPGPSDPIALRAFRKRGKETDVPAYVGMRHLIIPLDIKKELVDVVLPKDDKIKIFAMTLER
jgi:hypothetical protein